MNHFNVTYQIVTPEAEDSGFVVEGVGFREALEATGGYGSDCEADSSSGRPRWLTFYRVNDGTRAYYETGAEESRSLHIPDTVTDASARRIAHLCGAYGY